MTIFRLHNKNKDINTYCGSISEKRRIIGIDNVVDEEVYDHFDEIPLFFIGMPMLSTGDYTETSYMHHDQWRSQDFNQG